MLAACLLTSSCVSTYNSRARASHRAYHRGDYERALKIIEKTDPAPRDRLLYLMDKGMILHAAGNYEESNRVLTKAEELAESFTAKSVSRETAATLWSEEATNYGGDRHERVLIPVIRMINYIMQDEWDEAMVEVRRVEYVVERAYGAGEKPDNAFATYLSAVVWEAMGKLNDAQIDYARTGKIDRGLPYYAHDLKYTGGRLAMPARLPPKGSGAWRSSRGYRREGGELIVLTESGRSPRFVSEAVNTGYQSVQMPSVVAWSQSVRSATVYVDGVKVGETYAFYSVGDDILKALKDRRKRSFVRKAIKMAVQTGIYVASLELMDTDRIETQIAGIALMFLGMSMAAAEKADERSWRTLPAAFGIGRFFVAPGMRELRIVPEGGGDPIETTVEIEKGRPKAVLAHLTGERGRLTRVNPAEPERVREARAREKKIEGRIEAKPASGNLKIDLAYARMEGGDYRAERLLVDGIEQGGNKTRALKGLVLASMVNGDYRAAGSWAGKGRARGSDAGWFSDYEAIAALLAGGAVVLSSSDELRLTERRGLLPALDWFAMGLIDEKSGEYAEATQKFAKAYELGLTGAQVEKRVMESFKRAPESFKKSEEGIRMMEEFAGSLLE